MINSITLSFRGGKLVRLTPKPYWSGYAQVLHCSQSPVTDYQRYMTWRGFVETTGKGDPSVFQLLATAKQMPIFLTKQMQEWIYGLLKESANGTMTEAQLLNAWRNLTAWNKAFNNKKGREQGFADYILHENEGSQQGLGYLPVIATGATVKMIDEPIRLYGLWVQKFEVLDVRNPNTYKATYKDNWMHIFPATNSLNLDNRQERIDPFPKMYQDRDTPWPLLGDGTNVGLIERAWLRPLRSDEPHPAYPYMPVRSTGSWTSDGIRR